MNITEILRKYTSGEYDANETNKALKESGSDLFIDPGKNVLKPDEFATHGLLDTGTGSLDKVEVKDGHLVNCDCGEMLAFCYFNGKTYKVEGTALVEA